MIQVNNMKMIADTLHTLDIPVYTMDITEDIPRPSFHLQQTNSVAQLFNRGTEVQIESQYLITYFADRKYLTAVQAQIALMELLSEKIQDSNYAIYPSGLNFKIYPEDGILECGFTTYNYHSIGAGTEESTHELMSQLSYNENTNERMT